MFPSNKEGRRVQVNGAILVVWFARMGITEHNKSEGFFTMGSEQGALSLSKGFLLLLQLTSALKQLCLNTGCS